MRADLSPRRRGLQPRRSPPTPTSCWQMLPAFIKVYWGCTGYWSKELDRALSRAPKQAPEPPGAPVAAGARHRSLRVGMPRTG